MMKDCEVIYKNQDAFGGWSARVISDGHIAYLQSRYQASDWQTRFSMSLTEWGIYFDDLKLYDPSKQDPAKLIQLIDRLVKYGMEE